MLNKENIKKYTLRHLTDKYVFLEDYIKDNLLGIEMESDCTLEEFFEKNSEILEDKAISEDVFIESLIAFVNQMVEFLGLEENSVEDVTIISGYNKLGENENFGELKIKKGEIICIVGPTGSGKSRLLGDIEWCAQGDTPTKRKVLVNGKTINPEERYSSSNKLVAQLSQNMNFVMDLSVEEFIELHARSRMVENVEEVIELIFQKANDLAGEKFKRETPITSLSGGQSRALMISDTAILSRSPIVLIDEIENAGIDRKRALDLLVGNDKIVLMATHDPILALMGDRRIIIKNGGIDKVMETSQEEKALLEELTKLDNRMLKVRNLLRHGERLHLNQEEK